MHEDRGFFESGVCEIVRGQSHPHLDGFLVDDFGLLEELLQGEFGGFQFGWGK